MQIFIFLHILVDLCCLSTRVAPVDSMIMYFNPKVSKCTDNGLSLIDDGTTLIEDLAVLMPQSIGTPMS